MSLKNNFLILSALSLLGISNYFINKEIKKYSVETGINLTSFGRQSFSIKEQQTLEKLAKDNYSTILLNPIYYQDKINSSKIDTLGNISKEYLEKIIDFAKNTEQKIILKPLINSFSEDSRTKFLPENQEEWFENYSKIILNLSKIAKEKQIFGLCIGCELDNLLEKYPLEFCKLISKIRVEGYKGNLIYATTFCEERDTNKIKILNNFDLDFIGIDFYVSMEKERKKRPYPYEFAYYLDKINNVSKKPYLLTEMGYRSIKSGNKWPYFNYKINEREDFQLQKNSFENALIASNLKKTKLKGIYFWATDRNSFVGDVIDPKPTGYSYFKKPAEKIILDYNHKRKFLKKLKLIQN